MEIRKAKVIVGAAGGSAGKGSKTYKISLPTSWVEAMKLNMEQREVELSFDGERIILSKHLPLQDFVVQKRRMGHMMCQLHFYDGDKLCTEIAADFTDRSVSVKNHIANPVKTAFGNNAFPSWEDFQNFLEERCIPKERDGMREYLEALCLDEYDPLQIICKTKGRMAEDSQWLEVNFDDDSAMKS
jgi:hypothetical protein